MILFGLLTYKFLLPLMGGGLLTQLIYVKKKKFLIFFETTLRIC